MKAWEFKNYENTIKQRLTTERGTIYGQGRRNIALAYPSTYAVGMASLGYQQVYRILNELPDTVAERAFLPDDEIQSNHILTYESRRSISDFSIIAIAIACEREILGVFKLLKTAGIPILANERTNIHPWIIIGGPLTYANPLPLAAFADVIVMGEAEDLLAPMCNIIFSGISRDQSKQELASKPGFFVPSRHDNLLKNLAIANDSEILPARSVLYSHEAIFGDTTLIEIERGCSRSCGFCVMRRNDSGMRLFSAQRVLDLIQHESKRIGLVGAAVSDHPQLLDIVAPLVARGCQVSLSSLRADRLTTELTKLLVCGGAKTLTVAADGASERIRQQIHKGINAQHLINAAKLACIYKLTRLKCYAMVGLPDESEEDIDELATLANDLATAAGKHTRVVLGISTFVPKLHTPLAKSPFIGESAATMRIKRLRKQLKNKVEIRADSTRWAWVEYILAQGSKQTGLQALDAFNNGGNFRDFKKAFSSYKIP
ncbi:MAG: radical SAM protein [Deltaproteobacteria bacterium]|nr:radical SAM protein [Deltaproteobacteria bacterium]